MAETDGMASGLRVLRRVAPPETPWEGDVARDESGRLVVLVDADTVPLGALWDADPSGHLVAPLDAERRPAGQDLVLPYCTTPLAAYLDGRGAADPLAPGEAVTLLVSVTRGLRERAARGGTGGTWWLTDDGMPLLVPDVGRDTGDPADTERVLTALADAAPQLRDEISAASERIARGLPPEDREREVFAVAAPAPLAPPSRRGTALGSTSDARAAHRDALPKPEGEVERPARPRWLDGIVDAGIADLWAEVVTGLIRRIQGIRSSRVSPRRVRSRRRWPLLVVGGVCAAAVLGIGLAWPSSSPAPDPRGTTSPALTPPADRDAPARDAPALEAATSLLRASARCAASACPELLEDPGRALAAKIPPGEPTTSLVEDFGDVAVVRADYVGAALLVVIAQTGNGWRVRDVYAADPPS
ncbi:hypothetical protein ABCS02_24240 [Microbacterium sp. X-17]|uniref:hypothetical protein n=1 Tax=Microbacterium sp. X-17 TaxID=3144404 RepID=UPI0031F56167